MAPASESPSISSPAAIPAPRPLNVLVVDDSPVERRIVTHVLEARGHAVTVSGDGAEALALFAARIAEAPFDAVVLDLHMPGLDGEALAAALRAHAAVGAPPLALRLVVLSGTAGGEIPGVDRRLGKPIDPLALAAALEGRNEAAAPVEALDPLAARPVFDAGEALRRARGRRELLVELIGIFLADAATQMASLHRSFAATDNVASERAAHRLKGSAMNISAWRVADLAKEIEERLRALRPAADLLPRLEAEIARARGVLDAFVPEASQAKGA